MSALETQRERASALARELVARAPRGAIACIFAGGSLARGDVWWARIDGELEVYSDVDVYVVCGDDASAAAVRAAAGAIAIPPVAGVRFLRAPDIGVYSRDDLAAQPARPGTIDLAVNHLLLHGDASVLERLPAPDPSRMARDEALYLLENRVTELAGTEAGAQGSAGRLVLAQALKARLDVHVAHAIVEGSFAPTLSARRTSFESAPPSSLDAGARDDIAGAYRAANDPAAWFAGNRAGAERERALNALTHAWLVLAGKVLAARNAETAVATRCRAGARLENAREAVRMRHRAGLPAWRAALGALRLSSRSPRAALRLDALVRQLYARGEYDGRHYAAHDAYIETLTRASGFVDGSREMRARTMHRVIS